VKVYIAEKPSVGKAIVDVLPKPHTRHDGYIQVGTGDCVTWCIGHLLEQAEPDAYDEKYKKWQLDHIPIIPEQWKLQPKKETKKQLQVVVKLIKQADQIVHMGDPDRVGQILVDEVINHAKVSQKKKQAVLRGLVNDMNPAAIQNTLKNLRQNTDFIPLATSALARARADWLYGLNMTRLCTLMGQQAGFTGVLSIGRVQTPVLGLVVKRDHEIEQFVSKPFYEVEVTLHAAKKDITYKAKWVPSEACEPYQDDEGRVLSQKLAALVVSKTQGQTGKVKAVEKTKASKAPPLPYNLSALQIDAANRFNLNAQKTLDICQKLYERYKLITYPRSDCRFLPKEHFNDRHKVSHAVAQTLPYMQTLMKNIDLNKKSKAWNDSKVGAHHAIIPTQKIQNGESLAADEKNIYDLICRQYLMQFADAFKEDVLKIHSEVSGGLFVTNQRNTTSEGWKTLVLPSRNEKSKQPQNPKLKNLKVNDAVECVEGQLLEKNTSPPKRFTDATLLAAMTGIARFVASPEIKKVLKDTDGLGTEATRAGIIELLFKRRFLTKKGKEIHSTDIGRSLINSLPDRMALPDMTAHWESQLESISEKQASYGQFMGHLTGDLHSLIGEIHPRDFAGLRGKGDKKVYRKKRRKSSKV